MADLSVVTVDVHVKGKQAFDRCAAVLVWLARHRLIPTRIAYWLGTRVCVRLLQVGIKKGRRMRWQRVSPTW